MVGGILRRERRGAKPPSILPKYLQLLWWFRPVSANPGTSLHAIALTSSPQGRWPQAWGQWLDEQKELGEQGCELAGGQGGIGQ